MLDTLPPGPDHPDHPDHPDGGPADDPADHPAGPSAGHDAGHDAGHPAGEDAGDRPRVRVDALVPALAVAATGVSFDGAAPSAGERSAGAPRAPWAVPGRRRRADLPADERMNRVTSIPFFLVHLLPLLAIFTGVSWTAVGLCLVLFYARMFFITAGYHRYFAHRAYRMGRVPQALMAFGGTMAVQKGPLWWAGHHRDHHRFSDTERDVHSPQQGFWWSHVGWILCEKNATTDLGRIRDFAAYPELRFLERFDWIGPWLLGITCFLIAGWSGLLIGFFLSTVLLWHATFSVNSLAHVFGRRRYATEDTSRNSALIAFWTMGEGWHNNHHYYPSSARQGFFWWEIDASWYLLKALSWLHVVSDLKVPPARVLRTNRVADGSFDIGMFRNHWAKASRSVRAAQASFGQRVQERRTDAAGALVARRHSVEAGMAATKESLETFVLTSLESAEELARLTRSHERELGVEG